MLVRELASWLGKTFEGDGERDILSVASLETAGSDQIAFVGHRKAAREMNASAAGCLVVPLDLNVPAGRTVIRAKDPRREFSRIILHLHPPVRRVAERHATAIVDETAVIGEDVFIGPYAVIGPHCTLAEGVTVGAHTVLGEGVTIGARSLIHSHVSIYDHVTIGPRAVVHSGVVLGADGFGFVFEKDHYEKFPQVGRVVIGSDVEIGANSTIDRAALGITSVGDGVKIDNMVHIAHNCRIDPHVIIVAQTGIAGGSVVEQYAVIGGQVGIADNVTIKARAIVGAKTGVPSSKILKGEGEVYWGIPARPIKEYLEGLAQLGRVAELRKTVQELQARVAQLDQKQAKPEEPDPA